MVDIQTLQATALVLNLDLTDFLCEFSFVGMLLQDLQTLSNVYTVTNGHI